MCRYKEKDLVLLGKNKNLLSEQVDAICRDDYKLIAGPCFCFFPLGFTRYVLRKQEPTAL